VRKTEMFLTMRSDDGSMVRVKQDATDVCWPELFDTFMNFLAGCGYKFPEGEASVEFGESTKEQADD